MIGFLVAGLLVLIFLLLLARAFVNANAASLASSLRILAAVLLVIAGLALCVARRFEFGLPLFGLAYAVYQRNALKGFGTAGSSSTTSADGSDAPQSTVTSIYFVMQLNHETGDLRGEVIKGAYTGQKLDELDQDHLIALYSEVAADEDSRSLLEVYLDRRFPTWREDIQGDADTGRTGTAQSGIMSEEEAYQILGLSPGASPSDIRIAHRRLMKSVHPDMGGSAFLAAKVNQAKDRLLHSH